MGDKRVVYLGTDEMIKANDCIPVTADELEDLGRLLENAMFSGGRGATELLSKVRVTQTKAGHR